MATLASQSYAVTRESASGGTCSCIVVTNRVLKTVRPKAATKVPAAIAAVAAGIASSAGGSANVPTTAQPKTSGLRGRMAIAARSPTMAPTPKQATIAAQDEGAAKLALRDERAQDIERPDHEHVREDGPAIDCHHPRLGAELAPTRPQVGEKI